jgi:hypothetical protein
MKRIVQNEHEVDNLKRMIRNEFVTKGELEGHLSSKMSRVDVENMLPDI